MTHKKLFLLIIALLPITTQCMKRKCPETTSTVTTQQNTKKISPLQFIRDNFFKRNQYAPSLFSQLAFTDEYRKLFLKRCNEPKFSNTYITAIINGYSPAGIITFATKSFEKKGHWTTEELSYKEKKELIDKFLALGITPTEKDKQVSSIEKHERLLALQPQISTFGAMHKSKEEIFSQIPKEVLHYISCLSLATENQISLL